MGDHHRLSCPGRLPRPNPGGQILEAEGVLVPKMAWCERASSVCAPRLRACAWEQRRQAAAAGRQTDGTEEKCRSLRPAGLRISELARLAHAEQFRAYRATTTPGDPMCFGDKEECDENDHGKDMEHNQEQDQETEQTKDDQQKERCEENQKDEGQQKET